MKWGYPSNASLQISLIHHINRVKMKNSITSKDAEKALEIIQYPFMI